jgi:hypothetical protein
MKTSKQKYPSMVKNKQFLETEKSKEESSPLNKGTNQILNKATRASISNDLSKKENNRLI